MVDDALFSSKSSEYETPQWLFSRLDHFFHFTLDAAATAENTKCLRFITKAENSLIQTWSNERVWLNPPYSRGVGKWLDKVVSETIKDCPLVVVLLAARTDTMWFHNRVLRYAHNILFVRGRLHFSNDPDPAPFPSIVVIFEKADCPIWECGTRQPHIGTLNESTRTIRY